MPYNLINYNMFTNNTSGLMSSHIFHNFASCTERVGKLEKRGLKSHQKRPGAQRSRMGVGFSWESRQLVQVARGQWWGWRWEPKGTRGYTGPIEEL